MIRLLRAASLIISVFWVVACEKPQPKSPRDPPPEVNLPPSPTMTEPTFVAKYTDGSFTVAGLLSNRTKHIGTEVKVKGAIQKIHRCPEPSDVCKPSEYAVLVDDLKRPYKRLVITGGDDTGFDKLEANKVVLVEGRYVQSDPAGVFVRMEGLLLMRTLPESNRKASD